LAAATTSVSAANARVATEVEAKAAKDACRKRRRRQSAGLNEIAAKADLSTAWRPVRTPAAPK